MKIELSDVSGLPDALKALVETTDDKSTLDLSKLMPTEDLTGIKTALVKERENNGVYSKLGKPDEIAQKIADLEAQVAKGGKGGEDAQAKLDALEAKFSGQIETLNAQLSKERSNATMGGLKAELAKVGVVPEGIDMLATFAAQRIQFNDDGSPKVLSPDGKPMIGSGADHGATIADLAKELAGSMPYLVKDSGAGGGGKPPGSDGGKPAAKTMKRSAFDALDADAKRTAMRDGTTLTD